MARRSSNGNGSNRAGGSADDLGFEAKLSLAADKLRESIGNTIGLVRRMNATLEEMAKALFKGWFVDSGPVRAKMDGRRPAGMDAATAAVFPAKLQDSPLGLVPEGWRVRQLGEIIELAYGEPLKAEDRKPGPFPVYGSNGRVGWHNESRVRGPSIVVGRKGNPGVVTWAPVDFYPIDTTFCVRAGEECQDLYFLYYALRAQGLASLSADSAVPGLNRNHAYVSKQLVPPPSLLKAFGLQVRPLFDSAYSNERQIGSLGALRDALLPKLLNAEINDTTEGKETAIP